jgi:ribosome-associated toxin RatA of RatAB toxin-antitoxin module
VRKSISNLLAASVISTSIMIPIVSSQPACARQDDDSAAPPVVEEQIDKKSYEVTRLLVKARPEQVWQVLTDYNGAPAVFKTVKRCQVLSDKGTNKVIEHEIKPSGLMTSFKYDLEIKEVPNRYLQWHRISGDFKEVEGFWRLDPIDSGKNTMVTYASHVNAGIFIPQALIKRQHRIDMPAAMVALKGQAERTMQLASRHEAATRTP